MINVEFLLDLDPGLKSKMLIYIYFFAAKVPHRLTLFYICNEIVQTCRRKHAIMYKDAFKEVLKDAVLLVRYVSLLQWKGQRKEGKKNKATLRGNGLQALE